MIDRLALVFLLAGCAVFAVIIASEIRSAPGPQKAAVELSPLVRDRPLPAARPEPAGRYDEMVTAILARPLFNSTRRPPPRDGADATTDTGLSGLRLTGIVTTPGHRIAIFAPPGDKLMTVTEGDTVSGWRVETITPRDVSLTGPAGTKTLEPKIDPNLVPPPPPTPPPPSANANRVTPANQAAVRVPGVPAGRPRFLPGLPNRAPLRPGQLRGQR